METASVYRERFTNRPLLPDGSSSIAVRLRSGCWMLGSIALALPAPAQDGGHLRRRCDSLFVRKVDCNGYPNAPFALLALLSLPVAASAQPALYILTVCQGAGGERNSAKIRRAHPSVVFSGTGTFEDCVLAPDGLLSFANDNSILRLKRVNDTSLEFQSNSSSVETC